MEPVVQAISVVTDVRLTTLDSVLNINSLFTFAIFIGVTSTASGFMSLEGPPCNAGSAFVKSLFLFEFLSFSCFLSSSLVALGLKFGSLARFSRTWKDEDAPAIFRLGLFFSGVLSWFGCLFLTISMVLFIQIRLGIWSCGATNMYISVCVLVLLAGAGLLIYLYVIWVASTTEIFGKQGPPQENRRCPHSA